MTPEEEKKLGEDYALYLEEAERMKAEGKAIGTFIGWQYKNHRVNIKIAKTKDEHFRSGGRLGADSL